MPYKRKRGEVQDRNTKDVKSKKTSCKKMGCGENQLMAQPIQETVHKI